MKKSSYIRKITALLLAFVMLLLTSCSAADGAEESATGDADQGNYEIYNETTEVVK